MSGGDKVHANGRKIACKASSGYAVATVPDVCWSPPPPPLGPIPLPYPNTAFARDTTQGSKTVLICGIMVMKQRQSCFAKSTGDEPATEAFPKGINSHALTGSLHFASWSPDVRIEGKNADRHLDLTTHNHERQQPDSTAKAGADADGTAAPQTPFMAEVASLGRAIGSFDESHGKVLTRLMGAVQAFAGGTEALTGLGIAGIGTASTATGAGAAPGVPAMIGGWALAVNGIDNAQAGLRTALTGQVQQTAIAEAAGTGAHLLGASDDTAARISAGTNLAQGFVGFGATGAVNVGKALQGSALRGSQAAVKGASRFSSLSSAERRIILEQKLEANAMRHLEQMQSGTSGAHFVERHGAQLSKISQLNRAEYGINPTTWKLASPATATRFLSARDQLNSINRAELIFRRTGSLANAEKPIKFGRIIGEGYEKGTLKYGTQTQAIVRIDPSGKAYTAFPRFGY